MRWLFTYDANNASAVYWEMDETRRIQREVVKYGPCFDIACATTRPERLSSNHNDQECDGTALSGETPEDRALNDPDMVYIDVSPAAFESIWHTARHVAA